MRSLNEVEGNSERLVSTSLNERASLDVYEKMLAKGYSTEEIVELTGCSVEEIAKLTEKTPNLS